MKILFTTFSYFPETSGVPIVVRYLAEGMAAKGHKVAVATRKNGQDLAYQESIIGVEVYRFDIGQDLFKHNTGDISSYIKFVLDFPKDVLVLECVQCQTTDILLPYLKDMKCKVVLHSHGGPGIHFKPFKWEGDLLHTIGHIHNWYRWKKYYGSTLPVASQYIDVALCLSLCASDLQYMSKTMKRVEILENAANDIFFSEEYYNEDYSNVLGIKSKEYILCIANYIPNKGQYSIVEAYSQVKSTDCALVLIGSRGNEYFNKVKALAESVSESSGKEIVMLTGVDRKYFPAIISHAKLFVMASKHEEYPVSLVEAMACGTPFVSTDAGCSRILPGGVTVSDRKELASFINILEGNEGYRNYLGECGRQYAVRYNQPKSILNNLENILNSL